MKLNLNFSSQSTIALLLAVFLTSFSSSFLKWSSGGVVQAASLSHGDNNVHREPRNYGHINTGRVYEAVESSFVIGGPISNLEKRDTHRQRVVRTAEDKLTASIIKRILLRKYKLGNDFRWSFAFPNFICFFYIYILQILWLLFLTIN